MKLNWNRRSATRAVYAFLVLAAAILFYYAVSNLSVFFSTCKAVLSLLEPFVYGFVIAYLINPIMMWIENNPFRFLARLKKKKTPKNKTRIKRGFAVLISYLILLGFLTLFGFIVVPEITGSITSFMNNADKYVNTLKNFTLDFINSHFESTFIADRLKDLINSADKLLAQAAELLQKAVPYLYSFMAGITTVLKNLVLGVIISIYMLYKKEMFCAQVKKVLYALLPNAYTDKLIKLTQATNTSFGGFITGQMLDSMIVGILCFIGTSILNIPYAVLIGVIVGVTNMIPYFGPFLGAIPSIFLILLVDPLKALWFSIFILILQQFDGNILCPKILGQTTGLSAFWVIFAIIIGGGLFGVIGMFIGVPLFSVVYSLFSAFISYRLEKKNLSSDTGDYLTKKATELPKKE